MAQDSKNRHSWSINWRMSTCNLHYRRRIIIRKRWSKSWWNLPCISFHFFWNWMFVLLHLVQIPLVHEHQCLRFFFLFLNTTARKYFMQIFLFLFFSLSRSLFLGFCSFSLSIFTKAIKKKLNNRKCNLRNSPFYEM